MNEATLEKEIGDLTHRKRIIEELLYQAPTRVRYGPLTLERVDADTIKPSDDDDRVYKPITIPNEVGEIEDIVAEADDRVEQYYNEL